MWQEFKDFAMKGNVIDLAIGIIIGAAFGNIVSSLVDQVMIPLFGLLLGGIDFTSLAFHIGDAVIEYGLFIQNVVDFLIIAFSIFIFIQLLNRLKKEEEVEEAEEVEEVDEQIQLLTEIRDLLKNEEA